MRAKLGVIGGTGLYTLLEHAESVELETPFGHPSGPYLIGTIGDRKVAFLARHGKGHMIPPHAINYRANIHGFKQLGVERLLSVSAVGSLKEEIVPGHLVLADQFFDRTKTRRSTFFNELAVHIGFAEPICPELHALLGDCARDLGLTAHPSGTYVCMEGPAFSTRAESFFYRSLDASVIGMTNLPEAKLAREAEICYATIALATDYDCWRDGEESVEVGSVLRILKENVKKAERLLRESIPRITLARGCTCGRALQGAVLSDLGSLSQDARERFSVLLGRFMEGEPV